MKIMSGGAVGADSVFATMALDDGIEVDIHTFEDHNFTNPISDNKPNIICHSNDELIKALPYLKIANKTLKRSIPTSKPYIFKLLCRDYFEIDGTDCVIAVGLIDHVKKTAQGGTGWAVQMALDKGIPVYLFDMEEEVWYYSLRKNTLEKEWCRPRLSEYKTVTGIGSRFLTPVGITEIKKLFAERRQSL